MGADAGWGCVMLQLGLVILMVTGIHFIEAYGLNPAIYSAHLKLHPLMVLTVLVVAEHTLGVWGLLLAGAICSFLNGLPLFLRRLAWYADCRLLSVGCKQVGHSGCVSLSLSLSFNLAICMTI